MWTDTVLNTTLGRPSLMAAAAALTLCSAFSAAAHDACDLTILVAVDAKCNPTVKVDPCLVDPWGIALRLPATGGHFIAAARTPASATPGTEGPASSLPPGQSMPAGAFLPAHSHLI